MNGMQRQAGEREDAVARTHRSYHRTAEKLVPVEIYSDEARTTNYRSIVDLS